MVKPMLSKSGKFRPERSAKPSLSLPIPSLWNSYMVINPAAPVSTGVFLEGSRPASTTTPDFLSHRLLVIGKAGTDAISRP